MAIAFLGVLEYHIIMYSNIKERNFNMKRKSLSAVFVILLLFCMFGFSGQVVNAKTAPVKLAKKSVTLTITKTNSGTKYGTQKISVKKAKNIVIKKIAYKSKNKKVATVVSKKVKAKAKGSTKITVTVKYKKKGKKKVYKKTLTMKVAVKVIDKRTNAVNNSNTKDEDYWTNNNNGSVITGTSIGTKAPSKAKGKYLKTINIGAYENAQGIMEKEKNCVTADIYSAFEKNGETYYCVYIKTNDSTGYLYSTDSFKRLIADELKTDYYDTHVLCVVFENETKLYRGESLFERVLNDLTYPGGYNYGGIYNLNYLDTTNCKNFDRMFNYSFSAIYINKIDFYLPETFNTANATSMYEMFQDFGCDAKESSVTLPAAFDTSKVEDLKNIFSGMSAKTLNLPEKFVIAKFDEGTEYAESAEVEHMFYASDIEYINAKTPLNLKYCEDCICFSSLATLANQKAFVDSLDFTYLNDVGLALYRNSDKEFIDYVTNKIFSEAKNLKDMDFMYCNINVDSFTLDMLKVQHLTEFVCTFEDVKVKTLILKNAVISDANEMFSGMDCQTLDISTCTFTDDCDFEDTFKYDYNNEYQITIYVKDAAMQQKIIEVYNQDNPNKPITEENVIIGSYK